MPKSKTGVWIGLLMAAFVSPTWAADDAVTAQVDLARSLIESGDVPAAHQALARYYQAEANDHRMLALSHRTMGDSYLRARHRKAEEQQKHCDEIAGLEERISQAYEKMAKTHAESSKR